MNKKKLFYGDWVSGSIFPYTLSEEEKKEEEESWTPWHEISPTLALVCTDNMLLNAHWNPIVEKWVCGEYDEELDVLWWASYTTEKRNKWEKKNLTNVLKWKSSKKRPKMLDTLSDVLLGYDENLFLCYVKRECTNLLSSYGTVEDWFSLNGEYLYQPPKLWAYLDDFNFPK